MGMGTAAMVQIRHVREPTSREGVAAHTAKFDDDVTVRNNARLYGDDQERALGKEQARGDLELKGKKKNPPGGTSAHRDRKRELGSLTTTARTGLQE